MWKLLYLDLDVAFGEFECGLFQLDKFILKELPSIQ